MEDTIEQMSCRQGNTWSHCKEAALEMMEDRHILGDKESYSKRLPDNTRKIRRVSLN